ncbi:diguanylate cyclase [Pseudodesulfovibrio sp. JC047]|uniref:sensor domain-containing diguanylate cyclase n=1 Tax=Pseudodesulfovibrio sp. JC047 TaxID=2683199 RepID=UPI0013D25606|nr:sensor domain-containing diguanylate cyclase [Pseudodesulfovibrio sp. JC047]NDV18645.1 diguanylate cyclase [Pseudodesulfovibrio sp. JC047]
MKKEVFQKEKHVLSQAEASLAASQREGLPIAPAFVALVKGYDRLLRQSQRLVTMGDRMQQSLTVLNRDLEASEVKYRGIFENVTEGVYRCDAQGAFIEVNPALSGMFGFAEPAVFLDAIGTIRELFCHEADFSRYTAQLESGNVRHLEVKACGPDGVSLWAEFSASRVCDTACDANCNGIVGIVADVTERKTMTEEMCRLARTDSLTGLWNRGYFMELATREIARSKRGKLSLSLLIIDADYFKGINDAYGHDVGDKVLVALSGALLDSVREVDVVGRFGGEEFVVLLPDAARNDACCVAERILEGVRQVVVDAGGVQVSVAVSIGLASLESGEETLDGLLKFADIALYAAKKNGRDRAEVYHRSGCVCAGQAAVSDTEYQDVGQ